MNKAIGPHIGQSANQAFVLIPPGTIAVDGLQFDICRPYYLATTELSNGQYAELTTPSYRDYKSFVHDQLRMARQDPQVPLAFLAALEQYIVDPEKPALLLDLAKCSTRLKRLSIDRKMKFRLPTIGEFFLGMRAGSRTTFWFGDHIDPKLVAWNEDRSHQYPLSFIRKVNDAKPNDWGLYHTVGNAAELVFPSNVERDLLRAHFGPFATDVPKEQMRGGGFLILGYECVSLGGAINSPIFADGAMGDALRTLVEHEIVSLRSILLEAIPKPVSLHVI